MSERTALTNRQIAEAVGWRNIEGDEDELLGERGAGAAVCARGAPKPPIRDCAILLIRVGSRHW